MVLAPREVRLRDGKPGLGSKSLIECLPGMCEAWFSSQNTKRIR